MLRIPFAWHSLEKKLVMPKEVSRGLNPNVVCLGCHEPLICRQGDVNVPHFAHQGESACTGETCLHKLAKIVLHKGIGKFIKLPSGATGSGGKIWHKLLDVKLEYTIKSLSRRADAVAKIGFMYSSEGKKTEIAKASWIVVEFCVTHPKDEVFLTAIRKEDIAAIEIYLPKELLEGEGPLDIESEIRKIIRVQSGKSKRWLNQTDDFAPFEEVEGAWKRRHRCKTCDAFVYHGERTCYECNTDPCPSCGARKKKKFKLCWTCKNNLQQF